MKWDTQTPASRKLSESEEMEVRSVAERWRREGILVFVRLPNLITTPVVTGILVLFALPLTIAPMLNRQHAHESGDPLILTIMGLAISTYCIRYLSWQIGLLRRGNMIVLTADAFSHRRVDILGRRKHVSVPWSSVEVREFSSSHAGAGMVLLCSLFAPGRKLIVKDKRNGEKYEYRSVTIQRYRELRAALIANVGLIEEHEVWRYE